jgi:hypothetical protein
MIFLLIGLSAFLILSLIAIRIGISKEKTEKEEPQQVLHQSGIYSVVKKSPREDLVRLRPKEDTLRQYLKGINENSIGLALTQADKERLAAQFFSAMDYNISEIESGDTQGCEFYYYLFDGDDVICKPFVKPGDYVTREDLFRFPQLIPPFHLGCSCKLKAQHGDEKMRDTSALSLKPLLAEDESVPNLPDWQVIGHIS